MKNMQGIDIINHHESDVRSYVRSFPEVFVKAKGSTLWSESGDEYIDFFAGAGALNYGHNEPAQVSALVKYIEADGIVHGLDMATSAKVDFIQSFESLILEPRGLEYKLQFTGPTGTNAVEAALKLARLTTGRSNIIAFTHSFHGVSLGSLSTTANSWYRNAAGVSLNNVTFLPYDGYVDDFDGILYLERILDDTASGTDCPAAVIVETVQGEGGVNVASAEWIRRLRQVTSERGILLIVDDIQAGCGRTGDFFSFEFANIQPDMIVLSKSISGSGLPMSLLLIKPEVDVWKPGQHNGTFRGNNLAFVTGRTALEKFWKSGDFSKEIKNKEAVLSHTLQSIVESYPKSFIQKRGRGLMYGLECKFPELAQSIKASCFANGLIIETAGSNDEVIKFMPALTIEREMLVEGLGKFKEAVKQAILNPI
jgi:diaminobutyrate-2-oxoglutarate transaminase